MSHLWLSYSHFPSLSFHHLFPSSNSSPPPPPQALYGKKQARPTPATQPPTLSGGGDSGGSGSSDERLCRDASVDVTVTMANKKTYVFKGEYWWHKEGGIG